MKSGSSKIIPPLHSAHHTRKWLRGHSVWTFTWPPNSPDINIIEHAWAELVQRIKNHYPQPQTNDELWQAIQEEWYSPSFNHYIVNSLYPSFPCCVQALLDSEGRHTKY